MVLGATFPGSLLPSCDQRELKLANHLGGFDSWRLKEGSELSGRRLGYREQGRDALWSLPPSIFTEVFKETTKEENYLLWPLLHVDPVSNQLVRKEICRCYTLNIVE